MSKKSPIFNGQLEENIKFLPDGRKAVFLRRGNGLLEYIGQHFALREETSIVYIGELEKLFKREYSTLTKYSHLPQNKNIYHPETFKRYFSAFPKLSGTLFMILMEKDFELGILKPEMTEEQFANQGIQRTYDYYIRLKHPLILAIKNGQSLDEASRIIGKECAPNLTSLIISDMYRCCVDSDCFGKFAGFFWDRLIAQGLDEKNLFAMPDEEKLKKLIVSN